MDPKQALIDAADAALDGNAIECSRALLSYAEWVGRGGFVPSDTPFRFAVIAKALDRLDERLADSKPIPGRY